MHQILSTMCPGAWGVKATPPAFAAPLANEAPWLVYLGGLPGEPITRAGPLDAAQIMLRAIDPISPT